MAPATTPVPGDQLARERVTTTDTFDLAELPARSPKPRTYRRSWLAVLPMLVVRGRQPAS